MPVLLGLILLAIVALGLFWLLRANPSSLAKLVRLVLVLVALLGVGGGLVFGMRFLPSIMPELMGLGGLVVTGLVARWLVAGMQLEWTGSVGHRYLPPNLAICLGRTGRLA